MNPCLRRLSLGLSLITVVPGCRSTQTLPSDLFHAVDRPIVDANPLQWIPITDSEYASVLMYGHEVEFNLWASGIAAANHPGRQRLQHWIDLFDGMLRRNNPTVFAAVPKPQAQMILTAESNAYVQPISVCLGRSGSMPGQAGGNTRFWQFEPLDQEFIADSDPDRPLLCVHRKFSTPEVGDRLRWSLHDVPFVLNNADIELNEDSKKYFSPAIPGRADQVVIQQIPDAISFYAGLFLDSDESSLAFFVAHELGHYYRAHGVLPRTTFQIYYDLKQKNSLARPQQSAALAGFGQRMEALRSLMPDGDLSILSANQKKEWEALNREAFVQQIGQYTAEQEADELALEWVIDAGFASNLPIRALLRNLELEGRGSGRRPAAEQEWDFTRCQAAFANGWKTAENAPVFVPIGDSLGTHHSMCYRAFNLFRDMQANPYQARGGIPPPQLLGAVEWKALQTRIQSEVTRLAKGW